ncbi:hypothetical protein GCM10010530_04150 [Kribbella aluminosa]
MHFHGYLVVADSGVMLVDAGVGPAGGEAAEWLGVSGRLRGLLGQVGVGVEDVDAVVLTHVHLDHVGWASDGVRAGFPRAEYVVQRDELEHVRGGVTYERRIRPIEEAGGGAGVGGHDGDPDRGRASACCPVVHGRASRLRRHRRRGLPAVQALAPAAPDWR